MEVRMYDKILVPLDGSAAADRGFEEAVALARRMDSSLVLLHVVDPVPLPFEAATAGVWQEMTDSLRKQGEALLQRARKTAIDHGIAADTELVEGRTERVAETIVAQVRASRCDLVVMGTHGRRGFSHALLGSDAERVLRSCPVPVLLVRHPEPVTPA
jgi:nucleotide-binding universal stress UspA family protein